MNLPADFAKIPLDSPASSILAFVPGTDQAKDAVMIAQIPTTIELAAAEAAKAVKIVYRASRSSSRSRHAASYAVNTTTR
jgi:hypothetical protein